MVLTLLGGAFLTEPHEHRLRDKHMAGEIDERASKSGRTVAIVGHEHLDGIAGELALEGHQINAIPLHTELDD
jgi:pheromone shutdown protein TraB